MQLNSRIFEFDLHCADSMEKSHSRKKVRQINYLVISLVKPLLWRIFCQKCVRVNFQNSTLCDDADNQFSVKTTFLVKSFTIKLISRNNSQVIQKFRKLHTVGNLLSRIFGKNFVKVTVLLKKLLHSWFDEIFLQWE